MFRRRPGAFPSGGARPGVIATCARNALFNVVEPPSVYNEVEPVAGSLKLLRIIVLLISKQIWIESEDFLEHL